MNPILKFFDNISLSNNESGEPNGCIIDGVHVNLTERSRNDLEAALDFLDKENCIDVVKDWDNYFLREDYAIRKSAGPEVFDTFEAYSLFQKKPYERIQVFSGSLTFAIEQAEKIVNK